MPFPRAILSFCLWVSILLLGYSCKKQLAPTSYDSPGSHIGQLTGPIYMSTQVQLGQPLIAFIELTGGPQIRWTASSSYDARFAHVTSAGYQAMFIFEQPGCQKVMASSLGLDGVSVVDSSWALVQVLNTVYKPTFIENDIISLVGDQVSLTPTLDSNANLIFLAQTRNTYGCFSSIVYSVTSDSNGAGGLNIDLQEGIDENSYGCKMVENPASAYLFPSSQTSGWAPGDYPISVSLNGATYSGTLNITADAYTINWNYTAGVTFTQTQIKK